MRFVCVSPVPFTGLKTDMSRCESYNTAQLRLLTGTDENNESELALRTRAIPVNIPDTSYDSISATSLGVEPFDSANANPRWRPSTAASTDGRPRQRAVSPTVGNYFEMSRDSTWAASIFSRRRSEGGNEEEEPGFWATSPLRKYAFFGKYSGTSDEQSDSDNESGSTDEVEDEDDNEVEDDEEDEIDAIEIFGHR